jgi:hypothetical protein
MLFKKEEWSRGFWVKKMGGMSKEGQKAKEVISTGGTRSIPAHCGLRLGPGSRLKVTKKKKKELRDSIVKKRSGIKGDKSKCWVLNRTVEHNG